MVTSNTLALQNVFPEPIEGARQRRLETMRPIAETLASHIWNRMPMSRHHGGVPLRSTLDQHSQSLDVLSEYHADFEALLDGIVQNAVAVTVPPGMPDNAAQRFELMRSEMKNRRAMLNLESLRVTPSLQAELLDLPNDTASLELARDLRKSVGHFVVSCVKCLEEGVRDEVIGTIDWPHAKACRFSYYRIGFRDTPNGSISWDRTFEFARHEQQLMSPVYFPLKEYTKPVPRRMATLLDSLPPYLRSSCGVIEGDLFRQDVVPTMHQPTSRQRNQNVKFEVQPRTDWLIHQDPAITLGPYVLGAWLCEERRAEQHRARRKRTEVDREQSSLRHALRKCMIKPISLLSKFL